MTIRLACFLLVETIYAIFTCVQEPYLCRANFYHLLLQEDRRSPLGKLYHQVQKLVVDITDKRSKPKQLIDLSMKR